MLVRRIGDHSRLAGIVVETEAYLSFNDLASHSARGISRKNASMFSPAGTLYVYPIHSCYCLNIVTEEPGLGSAVLVRALQPIDGLSMMADNRQLYLDANGVNEPNSPPAAVLRSIASGPGRLCQALSVDRKLDGTNLLTSDEIWLETNSTVAKECRRRLRTGPRIGISQAINLPLRYYVEEHACVSGKASDHIGKRTFLLRP